MFLCCWRICLVCLALELVGPCVVLGFSVGMEAFLQCFRFKNKIKLKKRKIKKKKKEKRKEKIFLQQPGFMQGLFVYK